MDDSLGRYAYGRRCKWVRVKKRGRRCHCNGKFVPSRVCASAISRYRKR